MEINVGSGPVADESLFENSESNTGELSKCAGLFLIRVSESRS